MIYFLDIELSQFCNQIIVITHSNLFSFKLKKTLAPITVSRATYFQLQYGYFLNICYY